MAFRLALAFCAAAAQLSRAPDALQDAVEGIAGLMRRFEELQPAIAQAQLAPGELQQVSEPAQRL
ncbi:unnamed protein product [Effrenium voratum]|nr:unnamed protein product [Effrenium voratum]